MWQQVQQQLQQRLNSYPVSSEEARKKVEADRTEEGPKLSLQERVAWGYYVGEQVTIVGLL